MIIVSYRGPGMAGGVSPALKQLMRGNANNIRWWFLDGQGIKSTEDSIASGSSHARLTKEIVDGHYRYCNEFLWPVLHDLPEHATYSTIDRASYERFNRIFAREILRGQSNQSQFVHDYQLALLPRDLARRGTGAPAIFWHVPWPQSVDARFLEPMIDLAKAMLSAKIVGFHTSEYALRFSRFVAQHLPGVRTAADGMTIERLSGTPGHSYLGPYFCEPPSAANGIETSLTRVLVEPLPIETNHWSLLSRQEQEPHAALAGVKYVLSVDRADYTKGVTDRLKAIDHLFTMKPELKGKVTFAQTCTRTRPGLEAFDKYWSQCQNLAAAVNNNHAMENWQPVVDLGGPFDSAQLAHIYRNAAVMLVTPLRDGLNLTAKEFVACQTYSPGVLALSRQAGVWDELGSQSVEVEPGNTQQTADAILRALTMPRLERARRLSRMIDILHRTTLTTWCSRFTDLLDVGMESSMESGMEETMESQERLQQIS